MERKLINVEELKKVFRLKNGILEKIHSAQNKKDEWRTAQNKTNKQSGYFTVSFHGTTIPLHIVLWMLYTNTEIPNDFIIHHIDLNKKNNNIENLILLPTKLHSKYHMCIQQFQETPIKINRENADNYSALIKLSEVMKECRYWIEYKMSLTLKKDLENWL